MFGQIGSMYIIYVNAKGLPTLKTGGPFPYPDGTAFAADVHEFSVKDGSYVEDDTKAVTVMVRMRRSMQRLGGWGFQVWSGAALRNHSPPTPPMLPKLASPATLHKSPRLHVFNLHSPRSASKFNSSGTLWAVAVVRYLPATNVRTSKRSQIECLRDEKIAGSQQLPAI
jgi:hypothetical protein